MDRVAERATDCLLFFASPAARIGDRLWHSILHHRDRMHAAIDATVVSFVASDAKRRDGRIEKLAVRHVVRVVAFQTARFGMLHRRAGMT